VGKADIGVKGHRVSPVFIILSIGAGTGCRS
jgi:hypothetical protein